VDLCGDKKTGSYYEKQLVQAPTPGVDFQFQVNMTFIIYIDLDCSEGCEEIVFILKCIVIALLIIIVGVIFKLLKLI